MCAPARKVEFDHGGGHGVPRVQHLVHNMAAAILSRRIYYNSAMSTVLFDL